MEEQVALESLPDDVLQTIFVAMTIDQLGEFMMLNPRVFNLAVPIMKEKLLLRENQEKLALRKIIVSLMKKRFKSVIDLTHFKGFSLERPGPLGIYSPTILQNMPSDVVQVGQYPLIVSPDRYNEMIDIMNTVPMVPIYHI